METRLSAFLNKEASRSIDFLGGTFSSPLLGVIAGPVAHAAGMFEHQGNNKEKETKGQALASLIPGVGSYRAGAMKRKVSDDYEKRTKKNSNLLSEVLGQGTGMALGAGAGAALGYGVGDFLGKITGDKHSPHFGGHLNVSRESGMIVGSVGGAALPLLIASLAAAIKKTRTTKEQDEAESTGTAAANYLVPGAALYNSYKRLGHGYAKYQEGTVK